MKSESSSKVWRRRVSAFLIAVCVLTTSFTQAQGLGGILNKAKAKANQLTNNSTNGSATTVRGSLPATGEDPPTPPEMTPQTQEEYTRLLLSDARPVIRGQMNGSYTNWYRQLGQLQHVPIKFTWDQPALARCVETRIWLFGYIEDFSNDLVGSLTGSTREVYLRSQLAKVKEIHFTPSDKQPNASVDIAGEEQKWFYSFNPTTGVLTAGFGEYASSVAAWSSLSKWIIKNVK